jgi:chorismate lyase/3-hydroxybenzoate synthase
LPVPIVSEIPSTAPLSLAFAQRLPATGWAGVLGAIGFGCSPKSLPPEAVPFAAPDLQALDGAPVLELWSTDQPVRYSEAEGVRLAVTDTLLFGAMEAQEDPAIPLEEATEALYMRLFRLLVAHGYPHLFRVWNYFPRITGMEGGLERYRRFTLGRYEAFLAHSRAVELAPAACALGSASGPLNILFLAGRAPGQPLENPRQTSAYRYPVQYGPRSPTFSRALLTEAAGQRQLLISGTASIVGHESRHPDDPCAQAEEAMTNIRALIAEAGRAGLQGPRRLLLKTYIRHPAMLEAVRPVVTAALGPEDQVVFLKADICRPELLVEIEGAWI